MDGWGVIAKGAPATFVAVTGPPQDLPDSLGSITSLYIEGKDYRQKR
jgi:hypothetical protein